MAAKCWFFGRETTITSSVVTISNAATAIHFKCEKSSSDYGPFHYYMPSGTKRCLDLYKFLSLFIYYYLLLHNECNLWHQQKLLFHLIFTSNSFTTITLNKYYDHIKTTLKKISKSLFFLRKWHLAQMSVKQGSIKTLVTLIITLNAKDTEIIHDMTNET